METASDDPKASVQKMEEDLSCGICYNLFREPKDLDCSHVYCLSCLQDWVGKQPTIECPVCRYITVVPQGGLENLKSNLRLETMVEKYADYIKEQQVVPMCPDHDGERQHFYCLTCHMTVCHDCLVIKHPQSQHDIEELKVIAKSRKDELKVKMEALREQIDKSEESEKKLSDAEIKLNAASEKAVEDIEEYVQEMIRKLKARGHDMVQIVQTTRQQQLNLLKEKQNHTKVNTTRLRNARSATQNTLDSAANHVYMTQHAALVERVDRLSVMEHEAPSWDFDSLCFNPAPIPNDYNWLGDASLNGNKICGLKLVNEFGQFQKAQGIATNRDGLVAVVDSEAQKTEVFQSNGDGYESKLCLGTNDSKEVPYNVCVPTDGKFYVTVSGNQIKIFSPSGKYLKSVKSYSNGPIAASPDGTVITGNRHTQSITLLKCDDEKSIVMKTYNLYQNWIVQILSNGTQIVYTTDDVGKVCAIDFKTGQPLWTINIVWPYGICYEPKSKTLLIARGSKKDQFVIEQYCSATGRLISRLATGLHTPLAMTASHDNKLYVADEKTVKVFEIQ